MNRGDNGDPTESASGGLYRKGAQVRCWDKLDVKYLCGDKRPSGHKSRQKGPCDGKAKDEGTASTGGAAAKHSANRRNRNRIRRQLSREIYKMERREDIPAERRETEIRSLREQLKGYQRPPRPKCQPKGGSEKMEAREGRPDAQRPATTTERRSDPQRVRGPPRHSGTQGQRPTIRCCERRSQVPRVTPTPLGQC